MEIERLDEGADSIPDARGMTISEFIMLCTSITAARQAPTGGL
jgi:hypothetical protein